MSSDLEWWIGIGVAGLSLTGISAIGIKATLEFWKKKKTKKILKALFYVSVCLANLSLIGSIVENLILTHLAANLLYLCLLATLIVRHALTFKDSVFELSRKEKRTVYVLYAFDVLLLVSAVAWLSVNRFTALSISELLPRICIVLFIAVYVLLICLAVFLFCRNLLRLAAMKSSLSSSSPLPSRTKPRSKDLAVLSTKFLTLFLLAIGSTVATSLPLLANWYLSAHGVNVLSWTRVVLLRIDAFTNVLCLYLQHNFAKAQYQKCCHRLDGCTRMLVENRLQKRIVQEMMLAAEISAASNASNSSIKSSSKTSPVCAQAGAAGAAAAVERVSESSTQNSKKSTVINVGEMGGRETNAANSDNARTAEKPDPTSETLTDHGRDKEEALELNTSNRA